MGRSRPLKIGHTPAAEWHDRNARAIYSAGDGEEVSIAEDELRFISSPEVGAHVNLQTHSRNYAIACTRGSQHHRPRLTCYCYLPACPNVITFDSTMNHASSQRTALSDPVHRISSMISPTTSAV